MPEISFPHIHHRGFSDKGNKCYFYGAPKPDVMRYYLNSFITVFLLSSLVLDAQTDVSIRRKDFKINKSGFEEAWKHVNYGNDLLY